VGHSFGPQPLALGPGQGGSLVLSRTSPPLAGIRFPRHHEALHATASRSTPRSGRRPWQLAAHRIEWQLSDGFRAGISEGRATSARLQPLYLIGFIPTSWCNGSSPERAGLDAALRNNVVMSIDATWRVAEGTRVYRRAAAGRHHARSGGPEQVRLSGRVGRRRAPGGSAVTVGRRVDAPQPLVYHVLFGRDYVVRGKRSASHRPGREAHSLRAAWDPRWIGRRSRRDAQRQRRERPQRAVHSGVRRGCSPHTSKASSRRRATSSGVALLARGGVYVASRRGYRWIDDDATHRGKSRCRSEGSRAPQPLTAGAVPLDRTPQSLDERHGGRPAERFTGSRGSEVNALDLTGRGAS